MKSALIIAFCLGLVVLATWAAYQLRQKANRQLPGIYGPGTTVRRGRVG